MGPMSAAAGASVCASEAALAATTAAGAASARIRLRGCAELFLNTERVAGNSARRANKAHKP